MKAMWAMQIDLYKDFRKKEFVKALATLIKEESKQVLNIMEICGGHTHAIMKYALSELLPEHIRFIHGPGCPVCVLGRDKIDAAIQLAKDEKNILCTLGDLLRVPGSKGTLAMARAAGARVQALYSPLEVLKIASKNPDKNVIFFAIGFETTTPMSAVLIEKALKMHLKNFYFYSNHVNVPAPIHTLMRDPHSKIDAFLGPSHVSVIIGEAGYKEIVNRYQIPLAISGFEPVDIMSSVLSLVRLKGKARLVNEYKRVVKPEGNLLAQAKVAKYFLPIDFDFRGLGVVENGGMGLRPEFAHIDASRVFKLDLSTYKEEKACKCAEVLKGQAVPNECLLFGKACTPQSPVGACMVSAEGACAAYYKYKLI